VDTLAADRRLTRDDLRLVAAIGLQAGAAFENAQLYEKLAYDKANLHVAHQELKAAHERLIQSEKHAAVGRLASGIVHDIKNPLTVVLGYTGLIREKLQQHDPDLLEEAKIGQYLEDTEKGIRHCEDVLQGLLKFARPDKPSKSTGHVRDLVENTLQFLQFEINKAGARVVKDYQDGIPPVLMDANQIKQVFINIVLNALQAMDKEERELRVTTRLIGEPGHEMVRVGFRDNGVGMTGEQRRRIFDPFFTTKTPGEGTGGSGLGLSVSFGIVDGHGGLMEVESEPGEGTTFSVLLPVDRKDPAAGSSPEPPGSADTP
jgi:signal transduction histidine kinase